MSSKEVVNNNDYRSSPERASNPTRQPAEIGSLFCSVIVGVDYGDDRPGDNRKNHPWAGDSDPHSYDTDTGRTTMRLLDEGEQSSLLPDGKVVDLEQYRQSAPK